MSIGVFLAVLVAAAFHAGWNAIVKINLDRFSSITLIAIACSVITFFLLPFVAVPRTEVWPWVIVSAAVHSIYKIALIEAYRVGDFGQVYPIARGATPVLISLAMYLMQGETLGLSASIGVLILVLGVSSMSLGGGRTIKGADKRSVFAALLTAVFIATYTIIDGTAARLNGDPNGYTVWMVFLDGLIMTSILIARRGPSAFVAMRPHWLGGISGGVMSLGAYWIVVWATTVAPIGLVSAVRETSVLFGLLFSVFLMKEPLTTSRLMSALTIVVGVVLIRL